MPLNECPHMTVRCPHYQLKCEDPESADCLYIKSTRSVMAASFAALEAADSAMLSEESKITLEQAREFLGQ